MNNDIVRALSSGRELDYKFLSDTTAEIKKCATRLDASLALPNPQEEELKTSRHNDLSVSLLLSSLDGLIIRFVRNPTFKEAAILDRDAAPHAKRDLLLIIRLSEHLVQRLKELSKTGSK